jgi:hypothetical protein
MKLMLILILVEVSLSCANTIKRTDLKKGDAQIQSNSVINDLKEMNPSNVSIVYLNRYIE